MIKITLPDNSVKEFDKGITGLEIAESISSRLAKEVLAISVNGETRDLARAIDSDAAIKLLLWDDLEGRETFWHSSAHLMAEAIEFFYPGTKFGIGPTVDNGFYYDIDLPEGKVLSEKDLTAFEQKILELARTKEEIFRSEITKADALKLFTEKGDQYKLELISDLQDGT
ncbi:MAG TPA: TGS domain-containing protein, partial [Prolixibacteraceae bacterium]